MTGRSAAVMVLLAVVVVVDLLLAGGPVGRRWPVLARTSTGAVRGPCAWALASLVRLYRAAWSGRNAGMCRFEPSCSAYALEAVHRHGAVRGGLLALARLLRCQPLSAGGYDPVPGNVEAPSGVELSDRDPGVHGSRPVGTIGGSRVVREPRRVAPVRALDTGACRPAGVDARRMWGRGPRSSVPVADRGREE
ncbi:membrane protein insertion efficiency factor YidD [Frankia sp. R82]|uniref:membrane protein insertion efficiency factor YidD n=1 Tax=Frankia sp. R82 TaxID=2950553 RepID=UPI00204425AE|nr:membrane protein insertion efficiency factor YidD [Frankia sp. R82]MCM3887298.1 membrane protein insertion efficiency factor YidD [Frankia sp. R82]